MKLFTIFFLLLMSATAMQAATFTVNSTADSVDAAPGNGTCADAAGACSLRAAISEANALAGADTITLPAGTYTTTLPTSNENLNANGDLDIRQDLTITGAGAGTTFVEADAATATASDRVFHIPLAGVVVVIENLTVRNGFLLDPGVPFGRGGGIQNFGNLTLNGVTVSGNQTGTRAGGIHSTGAGNVLTLNNSTVSGNAVTSPDANSFGGGIFVENGTSNFTGSSVTGNMATSLFTDSFGFAAGYYALNGTHTFTRSNFSNNIGTGNGAGGSQGTGMRFNSNAAGMTVTITETSISNNSGNTTAGASNSGTGIALNAAAGFPINLNMTRSTVSGNMGSVGGPNFVSGAGLSGPGAGGGTINITNSTFSGNTTSDGFGGGISATGAAGAATVYNIASSTIASNSAGTGGGGVVQLESVVNFQNTIIADNIAPADPDLAGDFVSQGFNLVETVDPASTTGFPGANDIIGVDPQLQPLANNGGPTQTHALALTSPAIDTGNSTLTTDQRNAFRPVDLPNANGAGNASDIGAFEAQGATAAGVTVSGRVTARKGFGVARAIVSMTNQSGVTRTAKTDSNGNYKFEDVAAGETYVFSVSAPRYQFASQVVTISEDLDGLNFTSRR